MESNTDRLRANLLEKEADKRMRSWFKSSKTYEDCLEEYRKAANLYKMEKMYKEAGDCFVKTTTCHLKLDSKHEAAMAFVDAAKCYGKANYKEGLKYFELAISIYVESGKFKLAAKLEKELAEIYETENDDENAIKWYENAASHFDSEGQRSPKNHCISKLAELKAKLHQFDEAIQLFEQTANEWLDDTMLYQKAKEYHFKAAICHLAKMKNIADELMDTKICIETYFGEDEKFAESREGKLVSKIIRAIEEKDLHLFKQSLKDYDSITPLDTWKTNIFLHIKNNLDEYVKTTDIQ